MNRHLSIIHEPTPIRLPPVSRHSPTNQLHPQTSHRPIIPRPTRHHPIHLQKYVPRYSTGSPKLGHMGLMRRRLSRIRAMCTLRYKGLPCRSTVLLSSRNGSRAAGRHRDRSEMASERVMLPVLVRRGGSGGLISGMWGGCLVRMVYQPGRRCGGR